MIAITPDYNDTPIDSLPQTISTYASNPWGWPALHYAIYCNQREIARQIIELYPVQIQERASTEFMRTGALSVSIPPQVTNHPTFQDAARRVEGYTALELAIRQKQEDIVELLLKKGANPSATRLDVSGSMTWASRWEYYIVVWYIDPLYTAIDVESLKILKLLIEYGADINKMCRTVVYKALGPTSSVIQNEKFMNPISMIYSKQIYSGRGSALSEMSNFIVILQNARK